MHLLILNLTTSQATLRMRVWRTLKQSGAAVLRDGVYLLPDVRQGYDTFLSACQAIRAEGGAGYVFTIESAEEEALRPLFDRREQYDALLQDLQALQGALAADGLAAQLKQLRKIQRDYRRIEAIDFFPGAAREQAAERLATLEQAINQRLSPDEPQAVAGELSLLDREAFRGRLWATRRRPWVDRLASAWLIQRFIDPEARFLWLAAPEDCPATAVGFDFDGAPFSHVGTRVTFEVLVRRFALEAAIPDALGRLIHFLDVGGEPTPEAAG
ncbi:chromate resistance protein ChrB domain-containing protein, partial [Klebsiella pneumoniae]